MRVCVCACVRVCACPCVCPCVCRCGALHAGDRLLSINNKSLEASSLPDAVQMLLQSGNTIRLEVVPGNNDDLKALEEALATGGMKSVEEQLPPPPMDLLVDDGTKYVLLCYGNICISIRRVVFWVCVH